ncbi:MAG: HAMP domain-containing histidine kinase [Bacteriovoracaceae bacterium]|nr:HAMP domain-containing histidine kinase [Bacteriovoracaceae bacterium]
MKKLFGLITLSVISILYNCIAVAAAPKVLVMHSYSQGYPWTKSQMTGIQETFEKFYPDVELAVEYMDWKNYPDEVNLRFQKEKIFYKYAKKNYDLVIVTDNVALDLILSLRKELFPNASIIFSGINHFKDSMLEGEEKIGGIIENVDYEHTIELMLNVHPETKQIAVILDSTQISQELLIELKEIIPRWKNKIDFKILHDLTMENVLTEVSKLPKDALLLSTNFSIDKKRRIYKQRQALRIFSERSPVPVYGLWGVQLGYGIVGGWLLDGKLHGKVAAELALKSLKGEEIPVIKLSLSRLVFDYKQLKRFNISLDDIPDNAEVINHPLSLFRKYRLQIFFIALIIGILIILNLFLMATIRRRKLAEEERDLLLIEEKKARQSAEEAVKARETFIAIAAHELRTPLTVLTLQLQLLLRIAQGETKKASTEEETIQSLFRAETQTKRLKSLIEDLIYVAQENPGQMRLDLEETNLREIIKKVEDSFENMLTASESKLIIQIDGVCKGLWDSNKLEKLIGNLLSNAIKFGNQRPIELLVKAEKKGIVLKVKDQGIGIYREDQARIFEKFGRAVSELNFGGFGLGLYISQLITEAHKGTIKVESEPGIGSVFTVFLPYRP